MTNRPKQIGTAGETAVLRCVRAFWPDARRVVLHGGADQGDIHAWIDANGIPGIVFEVKAGKQAAAPSDSQIVDWHLEARMEEVNARALFGFLVLKRPGKGAANAGDWWAYTTDTALLQIATGDMSRRGTDSIVRLRLADLCSILVENEFRHAA